MWGALPACGEHCLLVVSTASTWGAQPPYGEHSLLVGSTASLWGALPFELSSLGKGLQKCLVLLNRHPEHLVQLEVPELRQFLTGL